MTDPTAGASTDPVAVPESATDAPAPDTTPDPSTTTEAAPVADPTEAAPAAPEQTPSESTAESTEFPAPSDEASVPATEPPGAVAARVVAGLDSSVEQGNRVTITDPITHTNPIADVAAKIEDHFAKATPLVADLRALADELELLLSNLRTGL